MLRKSLLILAIAAACATAQAQSTPTPKKDYVTRILKAQQPGIEQMARGLVQEPLAPLIDAAGAALQQRVPADKRDAVAKQIQADTRKFADETIALVRERALKLAPTTIGPILEEKFSEDELKQVAAMLESPVLQKFQSLGGEIQRTLIAKVVAETRGDVEPRLKALEESISKRLAAAGGAPAAPAGKSPAGKAPAKK